MRAIFVNKIREFKVRFRYSFMISNDFIMKINLKVLLIIKRMISLNVNVNKVEKVVISSLSVLNNRFIIDFKSDAFEAAVFDEVFFKIKMKLNRSLAFFSTVAYFF